MVRHFLMKISDTSGLAAKPTGSSQDNPLFWTISGQLSGAIDSGVLSNDYSIERNVGRILCYSHRCHRFVQVLPSATAPHPSGRDGGKMWCPRSLNQQQDNRMKNREGTFISAGCSALKDNKSDAESPKYYQESGQAVR